MFSDADHEVIDSPEALFRHLYEEHGVEEACELDPDTAPLQFWLRRHADLERAERAARRPTQPRTLLHRPSRSGARHPERASPGRPGPRPRRSGQAPPPQDQPAPGQPAPRTDRRPGPSRRPGLRPGQRAERRAGREGRRPPGSGPTGRGAGPGWPSEATTRWRRRSAIRSFADPRVRPVRPRSEACSWNRCSSQPSTSSAPPPARPARPSPPVGAGRHDGPLPGRPLPRPGPTRPGPGRPRPRPRTSRPGPGDPARAPGAEEPVRPEAAWAVLWADLADTGRRSGDGPAAAGDDGDDLMAVANAVQARRRVGLLRR